MSSIATHHLSFYYDNLCALDNVSLSFNDNTISALIGPSGCGKSTYLRLFNRMNDYIDNTRMKGRVVVEGENIYQKKYDVINLRKKVGMVFQKPTLFPKSIFENVVYALRLNRVKSKKKLMIAAERALKQAFVWDEVKDKLSKSALNLSGGQQQRLCIARMLAINPKIILMDEPTSALDPISTAKIEEMILELKKKYTIVIITHNLQQARRISDYTSFFYLGKLIEHNTTANIFTLPEQKQTENYISGRFG